MQLNNVLNIQQQNCVPEKPKGRNFTKIQKSGPGRKSVPGRSSDKKEAIYDNLRGFLMLTIPLSHFTKSGAMWYQSLYEIGFAQHSLCGFIYITINVFVMQAFMFLSGYFSKNAEKAGRSSIRGILWPYLVFATIWIIAGHVFNLYGYRNCSYLTPPFALWFLYCLFLYRFLLRYIVRFKYALPASILMMFIAGVAPFGEFMALGRFFSYLPFFLIGYYLPKEKMMQIRQIRKRPAVVVILGAILILVSLILTQYGPRPSWYLLKANAFSLGVPVYADFLLRLLLLFIGSGWIIFVLNVLPTKDNFLTYVGKNTMPIYMFHLPLRQVFRLGGIYPCTIVTLTVACISLVSVIHAKKKDWELTARLAGIVGTGMLIIYFSGILEPLIGLCPQNKLLFYALTFGDAMIAGISFTAPIWIWLYKTMTDGLLNAIIKVSSVAKRQIRRKEKNKEDARKQKI